MILDPCIFKVFETRINFYFLVIFFAHTAKQFSAIAHMLHLLSQNEYFMIITVFYI